MKHSVRAALAFHGIAEGISICCDGSMIMSWGIGHYDYNRGNIFTGDGSDYRHRG